ncbi:MAG TPA: CBS domain-containing protein [Longimicrobiales bacterium]|nr:CBS domain-containing protein [Longimicrobiales bacterium]
MRSFGPTMELASSEWTATGRRTRPDSEVRVSVITAGAGPGTTLVRDAMELTVVAVVPEMTVRELMQVLAEHDISGVPVLDREGKVIGVVSMTDVLRLGAREALDGDGPCRFDRALARDIMTPVSFTLDPTDTLDTAVRFLVRGRIHRALVMQNGMLHGIITPLDVLQVLDREQTLAE